MELSIEAKCLFYQNSRFINYWNVNKQAKGCWTLEQEKEVFVNNFNFSFRRLRPLKFPSQ
jgi:hypothetical protein